jgi:hypothetical protein
LVQQSAASLPGAAGNRREGQVQKQERQAEALLDFYKRPDDPTGKSYQLTVPALARGSGGCFRAEAITKSIL